MYSPCNESDQIRLLLCMLSLNTIKCSTLYLKWHTKLLSWNTIEQVIWAAHQNFAVTFIVLTGMLEFCIYFSYNLATNSLVNTVSDSVKTYKQASNSFVKTYKQASKGDMSSNWVLQRCGCFGGFVGTQGGIESGTKLFRIGSGWHQLRRNLSSIGWDGLDMSNESLLRRRCVMRFLSGSIM